LRGLTDWVNIIGQAPAAFADSLSRSLPEWVTGSLSYEDARFLFQRALEKAPERVVEIGTASGFSTAVLAHALRFAATAALIGPRFEVVSYDISPVLYYDSTREVGDAARGMLPDELLEHVVFRNPAMAINVREYHGRDSIEFLFLDAHHGHPWPTLDLLATLDQLRAGGVVVMHDINLPVVSPEFSAWGVKYAFDDLDLDKEVDESDFSNIGSFVVPRNKARLRDQLLTILYDYRWETEVAADVVTESISRAQAAPPPKS
jgi:predicted O-methyltransferase YrrM